MTPYIDAARHCASRMMENAAFVMQELPALKLPADLNSETEKLCVKWAETKQQILGEIWDLIEWGEGSAIARGEVSIQGWIREAVVQTDTWAARLKIAAAADPVGPIDFRLLTESAANVLNSVPPNSPGQASNALPTSPVNDCPLTPAQKERIQARAREIERERATKPQNLPVDQKPVPDPDFRAIPPADMLEEVQNEVRDLVTADMRTPREMADFLEDDGRQDLRLYSEFIWRSMNAFLMGDPIDVDWGEIYDEIDAEADWSNGPCELDDTDVANILITLDEKYLLADGTKEEIEHEFRTAWEAKREANRPGKDFAPDTQQAQEEGTAWADLLQEGTEVLAANEISWERLQEIAEWAKPWAEEIVVLGFNPV